MASVFLCAFMGIYATTPKSRALCISCKWASKKKKKIERKTKKTAAGRGEK